MDRWLNKILLGNAPDVLMELPDKSINCCVTSPPYWGLRDYGVEGQLGLEKTPEEYVQKMVDLFREVRRVLRDDGTLWLNLGDTYAAGGLGPGSGKQTTNYGSCNGSHIEKPRLAPMGLKPKDLVGIPWRVAFALQADGWYIRSDIIWSKPNPMPESVTDRPTKSHEYIFLMSKSERYYYDHESIKEPAIYANDDRRARAHENHKSMPTSIVNGIRPRSDKQRGHSRRHAGFNDRWDLMDKYEQCSGMRNKRSVWTVSTHPFPEAHFATFPPDLIKPCILAGCPDGGIVLDPFMGAGTTGVVCADLGRNYIGIELNPEYVHIANERIKQATRQERLFIGDENFFAPKRTPDAPKTWKVANRADEKSIA
jgi:DNA modification methylase